MAATLVLPGDKIPPSALPTGTGKRKTLKLGPGLRHIAPNTIATTIAGALTTDDRKNAASIDFNTGRYRPYPHDLVIATITSSTSDAFACTLSPHTPPATLPHLAFEGASKKSRPQLAPHALVYCRVVAASRDAPPELTCVDAATGKAAGLGVLKGGMVFSVSLGMARRLLAPRSEMALLEGLGASMGFEVTVGRNGVVHVDAGSVRATMAVGRGLQEVDERGVDDAGQRNMVGEILKSI
ncbi:hypothetical protein BDU57DRAFT_314987 [Ampelomyces quisqualis]|uniref:Ribosomal RNA-processing protein 40 n=1 Tax=Ampelomyces quisqualis TaxID=50730 RepID=A0A6A5QD57_AMPQU|nr:hypothetical protein BDU57DRAFT_314987 [Ampelomyces quisqualis]